SSRMRVVSSMATECPRCARTTSMTVATERRRADRQLGAQPGDHEGQGPDGKEESDRRNDPLAKKSLPAHLMFNDRRMVHTTVAYAPIHEPPKTPTALGHAPQHFIRARCNAR